MIQSVNKGRKQAQTVLKQVAQKNIIRITRKILRLPFGSSQHAGSRQREIGQHSPKGVRHDL